MSTFNEVNSMLLNNHDKDACIEKMQGTNHQLKKLKNKQKIKAWKRGKTVKVEAKVAYIKEKRELQREDNKRREFQAKKEEVLGDLNAWKKDFFGVRKGKKFKNRGLEVRDLQNNIDDIVEEKIIAQHD